MGCGVQPDQFRAWRKAHKLKQKDAADLLGLKKRMIQYYEKGHRDGRSVKIPKSIRLACYAISQGIADYNGEATKPLQGAEAKGHVETSDAPPSEAEADEPDSPGEAESDNGPDEPNRPRMSRVA